jgi:polyferredoxin
MTIQSTPTKVKPRLSGFKALLTHQVFRRVMQFSFAAFILYVTVVHVLAGESSSNITASPEAYCPFGGLETFYKYITSGGTYVPHTHLSNLVLAAAVLITALLLRSGFCGWICPLGFIQDITALAPGCKSASYQSASFSGLFTKVENLFGCFSINTCAS